MHWAGQIHEWTVNFTTETQTVGWGWPGVGILRNWIYSFKPQHGPVTKNKSSAAVFCVMSHRYQRHQDEVTSSIQKAESISTERPRNCTKNKFNVFYLIINNCHFSEILYYVSWKLILKEQLNNPSVRTKNIERTAMCLNQKRPWPLLAEWLLINLKTTTDYLYWSLKNFSLMSNKPQNAKG